ncbi:MAG: MBL fold metallo-hydrolase [Actinomycetota bacterium]
MAVTFHGVRGSTPCHGDDIVKYGGNTSCVSLSIPGCDPIVFDLGTGLRYFGSSCESRPFRGTCLLSHLHWDHIQGLPFFTPLLTPDAHLDVYAPRPTPERSVEDVFADTIKPPLFPVDLGRLPGVLGFHEVLDDDFELAPGVHVRSRSIPHVGVTVGYRVEWEGHSVAYLSDHQMPCDGSFSATQGAVDLTEGVDLLIHDAQYTPEEFVGKCDWGHCTVDYAVWFASEVGAKRLALFHHDPSHDDETLDRLTEEAAVVGMRGGVEVFAAREGRTVAVSL